jgi:hypothetical protein
VECYEDGGALPLCDVALSQTYQNNRHLVVGGNYARSSWVFESGLTGFLYDEMEILTVECPAVEMGDLTVECYEDGGALPLCDVVRNEKVILY